MSCHETTNIKFYFLVLLATAAVLIVGIGGGLWGQQIPWQLQWQHRAMNFVCHQLPDRSYWINGQPMAICSRCLGIYGGFLASWLSLPLVDYLKNSPWPAKSLAAGAVLINLADILGNLLGFWENTLTLRLILGGMVGMSATLFFTDTFFNRNIKHEGDPHGRITTTGV
jgi:uncharacterized membrane protein